MSSHACTMETKSTPERCTNPLPMRRPTSDRPTSDTEVEPPVAGNVAGRPATIDYPRMWMCSDSRGLFKFLRNMWYLIISRNRYKSDSFECILCTLLSSLAKCLLTSFCPGSVNDCAIIAEFNGMVSLHKYQLLICLASKLTGRWPRSKVFIYLFRPNGSHHIKNDMNNVTKGKKCH